MFLGMVLGTLLSYVVFTNHIPIGTEISIGRVKLRGQDQTIENLIKTGDIISKKESRQAKRTERREKRKDR